MISSIFSDINGEFSVFGRTITDIKKNLGAGKGLWYSIWGKTLSDSDLNLLEEYERALQDVNASTEDFAKIIGKMSASARKAANEIATGATTVQELRESQQSTILSTKALSIALNVGLMLAVTAITSAISYYIRQQEEAREATIAAGKTAKDETDNILELRKAYYDAQEAYDGSESSKSQLEDTTNKLLDVLGVERESVQGLAGDYKALNEVIDANTYAKLRENAPLVTAARKEQEDALVKEAKKKSINRIDISDLGSDEQIIRTVISDLGIGEVRPVGRDGNKWELYFGEIKTAQDALDIYEQIEQITESIANSRAADVQQASEGSNIYDKLLKKQSLLLETVNTTKTARESENDNAMQIWAYENKTSLAAAQTAKSYNTQKEALIQAAIASNKFSGTEEEIRENLENILKLQPELEKFYKEEISPKIDTKKTKADLEKELEYFQKGGSVNLKLRPVIDAKDLKDAGWEEAADGIATVFSSTFSNEAENIAMNFTPIIADPKTGEYKGILTPEELEKYAMNVINGVDDDYLHLQIGAVFEGDDAIAQAEKAAQAIHQIQEELYGDTGIVSSSFGEKYGLGNAFGGWIDNAEEYVTALEAVESEMDIVSSAMKEYDKNGRISAATAKKLINANGDYQKAIKNTANGIELETGTLKENLKAYINKLKVQYEEQTANIETAAELADTNLQRALETQLLNQQVIDALGTQDTKAAKSITAEDNARVAELTELAAQANKNLAERNERIEEYNEQIRLLEKYSADVDSPFFGTDDDDGGSKTSTTLKSHEKNTNRYNLQADWLKDQENAIDKLKEDYNKINTLLERAIKLGDEEQIRILSSKLNDKSKEIQDLYAKGASEGRVRFSDMQSQLWNLVPQLKGKKFEDITEQDWEAVEKWLDDNITAQNNIKIDMENANSDLKDANKDAIDAANNLKTTVTELHSNMSSFYEAFGTESGDINRTFSKGWADEADNQIETVKSEFEAINDIFDKGIEEQKKKIDKVDLRIDLLDEKDYAGKMDLIAEKSQLNAENAAKVSAEIDRIKSEFEDSLLPAEEYNERMSELENQYNDCIKSGKEYKDTLKDIAQEQIDGVVSIENEVKGYLEDYMDMVEDNAQKEIDAAEKSADAKKEVIEAQKKGLKDYQDQLEKQWDAEDERDARREKLDERNKKAEERAKSLTAAASGDLEALSKVQDIDKEIAEMDKELQDDLEEQRREAIKDAIQEASDALDKQADKLDEQLDTMKKQLEEQQKTNEELLKGESGYALIHALMAGANVKLNGQDVDLATMRQAVNTKNGNAYSYGYNNETVEWQKNLSESLASVANLTALNELAEGKFTLKNGTIILGDGTVFDGNTLSHGFGEHNYADELIPVTKEAIFESIGLTNGESLATNLIDVGNMIRQNKDLITDIRQDQSVMAKLVSKTSQNPTFNFDNILNVEGNVTEDVLPLIRSVVAEELMPLLMRGISTGFSANGITGKSKTYR